MHADLIELLACPPCRTKTLELISFEKSGNEINEGILICPSCRRWYPVQKGIPIISNKMILNGEAKEKILSRWKGKFNFSELQESETPNLSEEAMQKVQIDHFTHETENYDVEISDATFWKAVDRNTIQPWILESKDKHRRILEMGCGTGRTTMQLLEADCRIVAVDICFSAAEKTQAKAAQTGKKKLLDVVVAEAECLPFRSASFSAVIFTGFLHHAARPDQALLEIGRLLKNHGVVFGYENNASGLRFLFDVLMRIKKLWNEEAGLHPVIDRRLLKEWGRQGGISFETRSVVFLPPHFINPFPLERAQEILASTDRFFQKFKPLKNHGGLIVFSGIKNGVAS